MKSTQPSFFINYDLENACVVMKPKGLLPSNEFRNRSEAMLEVLKENKTSRILADVSELHLISQVDRKWLIEEFIPKAVDHGLKAVAFIRSANQNAQLSIEVVEYKSSPNYLSAWFDTEQEAVKWLKSF